MDKPGSSLCTSAAMRRRTTAVPVVFMLLGTSGTGEEFLADSRWREKADTVGFIAVFPTALTYCFREDENRDGDFVDVDELKATTSGHTARWAGRTCRCARRQTWHC